MIKKKGRPEITVMDIIEKPKLQGYLNILNLLTHYAHHKPPIKLKHLAVALCKKTGYVSVKETEYHQFFYSEYKKYSERLKKRYKINAIRLSDIEKAIKKNKKSRTPQKKELLKELKVIKSSFSSTELDKMLKREDFGVNLKYKFGSYSSLRDHIDTLLALGLIKPVGKTSYKVTQEWHEEFYLYQIHFYADKIPTEQRMRACLYLRSLCNL